MTDLRSVASAIITLLAGVVVPLIVLAALFLIGDPPAIIAAWERGDVDVIAHETAVHDTGYGEVSRLEVIARGPAGEERLLRLADDPTGGGAANLFPVGSRHMARLSPGGNLAYPDGETGMFTFAAFMAAPLILFVVLGIVFRPVIAGLAALVPAIAVHEDLIRSALRTGTALMSFITIPLFAMGLFWSLGDAPALRWFSPVQNAQIVGVTTREQADGRLLITGISVSAPGIAFPDVTGFPQASVSGAEAAQARIGSLYPARIYRHRPYALGWRWFDFVVIGVTAISLLIMGAGILAIGRRIVFAR